MTSFPSPIFPTQGAFGVLKAAQKKPQKKKLDKFSKGLDLYVSENYKDASEYFKKYLATAPNDLNAIVYTAKSFYKLDQIEESFSYFSRVDIEQLDVETSYEYGQVYYIMRRYPEALAAFKRVPPSGHALSDLANYFGGVCAIKTRNYQLAEMSFEKAEVLPSKLASRRKVYLDQLQKIFALKSKRDMSAYKLEMTKNHQPNAPSPVVSKSDSVRTKNKLKGKRSKKRNSRIKRRYKHRGQESFDRRNELGISMKNQQFELGGFGSDSSDLRSIYFNFKNGLKKFYGRSYRARSVVGAELDLLVESRSTDGVEQRNFSSDSLEDQFRIQETPFDEGSTTNLSAMIRLFYELPLTRNGWLDLSLQYKRLLPEFEGGYGGGDHGASASFKKTMQNLEMIGSTSVSFLRGENHDTKTTKFFGKAYASYSFAGDLSVSTAAMFDQSNYALINQSGPDSVATFSALIAQKFPLNIEVEGELGATLTSNYTIFPDATKTIAADSTGFYLGASAQALLFKYVKVYLSYQKSFEKWQVTGGDSTNQEADQETFDLTIPNILNTLEYGVSVNISF